MKSACTTASARSTPTHGMPWSAATTRSFRMRSWPGSRSTAASSRRSAGSRVRSVSTRRPPGRGGAALFQGQFARRIRLRLGLGQRLCAQRPRLLPQAAVRRSVLAGQRAAPAGRRRRDAPDPDARLLVAAIEQRLETLGLSSAHLNFVDDAGADALLRHALAAALRLAIPLAQPRLAAISRTSSPRSSRRSARTSARSGRRSRPPACICEIRHGDELEDAEWRVLHRLYLSTFEAHGNHPALTEAFFRHLGRTCRARSSPCSAGAAGRIIAAAFCLRSSRHPVRPLLGRRRADRRPAFRGLLLPGHRLLHPPRPAALRTGRPGRTQDRPRIPAGAHALVPSARRPALFAQRSPTPCDARARRWRPIGKNCSIIRRTGRHPGPRVITLPRLDPASVAFPPVESALDEPNGLLAFGGDLRSERLLAAYSRGIFPWYSQGQPILWWSPDPRMVIETAAPHVPRRLRRWLKACALDDQRRPRVRRGHPRAAPNRAVTAPAPGSRRR